MNFTPKSEKDLITLLKNGEYPIDVVDATDDISKASGKEMIKLKIRAYGLEGDSVFLFDYLLEAFPKKLRHACACFGMIDKYQTGDIKAEDFIGKSGRAMVAIQTDPSGKYADKNIIKEYLFLDTDKSDSDLPF